MDMDEYPEVENGDGENGISEVRKPFYLLNALSDLLMIPKDVLMETSTRKEVCPHYLFNKISINLIIIYMYELFICVVSLKLFCLMLPCRFSQLCPIFSSSIVRSILDGFLPDEFCPDPIQDTLLQALELEVSLLNLWMQ